MQQFYNSIPCLAEEKSAFLSLVKGDGEEEEGEEPILQAELLLRGTSFPANEIANFGCQFTQQLACEFFRLQS